MSIIVANSLTVTNSVSFRVLLSFCSWRAWSCSFSCTASRFSLRYLAPFLFWLLLVKRARVSLTWRATASSSTSIWRWLLRLLFTLLLLLLLFLFLFLFFLLPPLLPLFWPLPPSPLLFFASALMSTRSLLIRTRFLRSLCC